jgi:hypothetical protein
MEKKTTPQGQSYYAGTGVYQKEYDEVVKNLIPPAGEAETKHGELVRIMDNFVADFHEQDGQNYLRIKKEDCEQCGGSGWEVTNWRDKDKPDYEEEKDDCSVCGGDCTIEVGKKLENHFHLKLIYIQRNVLSAYHLVSDMEFFIQKNHGDNSIFDKVIDEIMYFVLTTENEPR